jgi:cyclic dehypoxanthinyl futalosine synthase
MLKMSKNQIKTILDKALNLEFLSPTEGLLLYKEASLSELMLYASLVRKKIHPNNTVSYIIDRNINLTNICVSNCTFCNFCRKKKDKDSYTLSIDQYRQKIDELYAAGGNQILLQGGLNPELDINYYTNLFREIKKIYPDLKLHALGPPEIVYISKLSGLSFEETLSELIDSGLDSLPGAGAEILSDRVRKIISPAKCTVTEWLEVMKIAHKKGLTTSATMMFGHVETLEERILHLTKIRDTQNEKPQFSKGFISFTLWPLAGEGTRLIKRIPDIKPVSNNEFLRMLAISRLMLVNIPNIQASWLTMGNDIAQLCLHAGANDMSSVMIEENVVSQAGKNFTMGVPQMEKLIRESGFVPKLRNQEYVFGKVR